MVDECRWGYARRCTCLLENANLGKSITSPSLVKCGHGETQMRAYIIANMSLKKLFEAFFA